MIRIILISFALLLVSCGDDPIPKPKAYLRLEYPKATYYKVESDLPFTFDKNSQAQDKITIKELAANKSYGLNVEYPKLKGIIYLTYKKVGKDNLKDLLKDAQNFTQEHTGNAASQSQFYVTDSVNHFVNGSLYFYAKPNYDSILPAANYLQKDIQHIMETIEWK